MQAATLRKVHERICRRAAHFQKLLNVKGVFRIAPGQASRVGLAPSRGTMSHPLQYRFDFLLRPVGSGDNCVGKALQIAARRKFPPNAVKNGHKGSNQEHVDGKPAPPNDWVILHWSRRSEIRSRYSVSISASGSTQLSEFATPSHPPRKRAATAGSSKIWASPASSAVQSWGTTRPAR